MLLFVSRVHDADESRRTFESHSTMSVLSCMDLRLKGKRQQIEEKERLSGVQFKGLLECNLTQAIPVVPAGRGKGN